MFSLNKHGARRSRGDIRFLPVAVLSLCLALSVMLRAQGPVPLATSSSQAFNTSHEDVAIVPGDVLTIIVFDTPELSGPARVSNDGTINFPLIGRVHVGGLSVASAANLIRAQLIHGDFLKDPQIAVNFEDASNHSAVVLGEIAHPGFVPLTGIRTLWEVVGAAGGVNPTAGEKVTILSRGDNQPPQIFNVDWNRDLVGQPNPVINPGDTVQISRAGIVYVLGEVDRQGGYPINHQHMTISEAIALAGGVKYTSKASHSRLVRSTSSSRVVSDVDVSGIIKGKLPDKVLQDNDIIYVPNSASKVAILRGLQAAVGITSSVIVYRNQ
jgi:polysaccharide export outer membrane protein